MATFASRNRVRSGGAGSTIIGADAVVRDFTREANEIRPRADKVVVEYAKDAAQMMVDTVAVDQGDVRDSITSDPKASSTGYGAYADAGPDMRANKAAFVARFLENGTVKMAPQPFVEPTAHRIIPRFVRAIQGLSEL